MEETGHEGVYSRSYQTKLSIARSLNQLCESQDFESVNVEDVARMAGISRSGFYYHFSNLNEVVTWLSKQFYANGIDQTGRTLTWLEGHIITTYSMHKYKQLFSKAGVIRDYDGGAPYFIRHRHQNLKETLTEYKKMELTKKLSFQIEAYPYIEKNMSNNFEGGKYDLSVIEYCRLLTSCVPRELFDALNEPVDPQPMTMELLEMLA